MPFTYAMTVVIFIEVVFERSRGRVVMATVSVAAHAVVGAGRVQTQRTSWTRRGGSVGGDRARGRDNGGGGSTLVHVTLASRTLEARRAATALRRCTHAAVQAAARTHRCRPKQSTWYNPFIITRVLSTFYNR